MASLRPRLKYLGSFGLQRTITHAEQVIRMGLRRRLTVALDDARGALSWQLVYKTLPGTLDGPVMLDGDEGLGPAGMILSRFAYLYGFYLARKASDVQSFIITDLFDGLKRDYLVVFEGAAMTQGLFMTRLFSAQGVTLVQVDEEGVGTLDDGSLGEQINPDQI